MSDVGKIVMSILGDKISENGFLDYDIEPDADLLRAGVIDSMDLVEVLAQIEALTGLIPDLNVDNFPENISLNWLLHSVGFNND